MLHHGKRIFVFGDSHARIYKRMSNPNIQCYCQGGITMHRIGRDGLKLEQGWLFNRPPPKVRPGDVFLYVFGEIDARRHIWKQCQLGRQENEVIAKLVQNYAKIIEQHRTLYKILPVVRGLVPPAVPLEEMAKYRPLRLAPASKRSDYFCGTISERLRFSTRLRGALQMICQENDFLYLDIAHLVEKDGFLDPTLSEDFVHISNKLARLLESNLLSCLT